MIAPRRLTEQEIKEAFHDAMPIVKDKFREKEAERKDLLDEIRASLKLSRVHGKATQEVWTEWVKLYYGPKLDELDRNLWRLQGNRESYRGESPHPDKITPDMIERAKEFPIESLADGEVKRFGKLERMLCPFHQEKTPSLMIYPNNSWHCFGCSIGGDSIDFARQKFGQTFPEAVRTRAKITVTS